MQDRERSATNQRRNRKEDAIEPRDGGTASSVPSSPCCRFSVSFQIFLEVPQDRLYFSLIDQPTFAMKMQAPIILLKEGTENHQGKPQVISNINACQAIAEAVKTTLGPRGMDKLIVDTKGSVTISNDGATILKKLDVTHPAARTLVDISKSQDAEVGDGTTSVALLAAEFLKQCKPFIEEGLHPQVIIKSLRRGRDLMAKRIEEIAVRLNKSVSPEERRSLLEKCAVTTLSSKLVSQQKEFFAKIVVDAVMQLDELLPLNMIGIKKVQGGGLEESLLVSGVAFKKTFSYAGFEMQPKKYKDAKIALLNIELELKAERDNAEVRVDNVSEYQKIVEAEWTILYDKLAKIHASGAKVVLSKLPIGDVATQYFADRDMFCAGRVPEDDLNRTMKACGGAILTTVHDLVASNLGQCEQFEEIRIGGERSVSALFCFSSHSSLWIDDVAGDSCYRSGRTMLVRE